MLRPTTPDDVSAILGVAVSSGLFPPDATDEVAAVLTSCLAGEFATRAELRGHFNILTQRRAKREELTGQILDLHASQVSKNEIARRLGVSPKTVRNHLRLALPTQGSGGGD